MTLVCIGLAGLVIVLYGAAIWHCLCRESLGTLLLLGGIVLVALVLRLVPQGYPWLYNQDEPHILYDAVVSYRSGEVWRLASFTSVGPPALLQILFGAQLYEWGLPPFVAMRAYSIGASVLSCVIGYGVARAMRLSVAAGVLVAAAYAVLPWALLYGRTSQGGEIVLHTGLVLLGISEALWSERLSGFAVLAVGAGLLLLVYDYYVGRMMLYVAMLTVPFMRWRRAVAVGAAISVAMLLYAVPVSLLPPPEQDPSTSGYSLRWLGISPWGHEVAHLPPTPVEQWPHRLVVTLRAFTGPYAENNWMTVSAGAWHPPGTLLLVLVGLLLAPSWRHRILLSLLCLAGLVPAVIGSPHLPALFEGISTHRLLIAFAGIPLCVACAVEALPSNKVRLLLVGAVLVGAGAWSTHLYFSDVFWTPAARRVYGDCRWGDIDCRGRRTP